MKDSLAFCEGYSRARDEILIVDILNMKEIREIIFSDFLRPAKRTVRPGKRKYLIRILFSF